MRLRHCLLATTLIAGTATAAAAQDPNAEPRPERRARIWTLPHDRRATADFYRFRMDPERIRIVERSLERAGRVRIQALESARGQLERAERVRDRARDRSLERNSSLRRSLEVRERAMERVRQRMDKLHDERRYLIRKRSRTI